MVKGVCRSKHTTKFLIFKVKLLFYGNICLIFARNTVRNPIVFRATNNTGKNGDKKQNTLPYTLQVKVVEVCLVGAGRAARKEKR